MALKGAHTDGHRFVADALSRGAAAIVSEEELAAPAGVTVVRVPQARLALAHLSAALLRPPQPGADPGGHHRHQRQDQHHLSPGGHPSSRRAPGWGNGHRELPRGGRDLAGPGDHPGIPGPATAPAGQMRAEGVSHVCHGGLLPCPGFAARVDRAAFDGRGLHQPLPGPPGLPPGPGRLFCRQVPPFSGVVGQRRRPPAWRSSTWTSPGGTSCAAGCGSRS